MALSLNPPNNFSHQHDYWVKAAATYWTAFRSFRLLNLELETSVLEEELGHVLDGHGGEPTPDLPRPWKPFFGQFDQLLSRQVSESRRRLIFFSNHVESLGESRKKSDQVILALQPSDFHGRVEGLGIPNKIVKELRGARGRPGPPRVPLEAISLACVSQTRSVLEVIRHFAALEAIDRRVDEFWKLINEDTPRDKESVDNGGVIVKWVPRCNFFTADFLTDTHAHLFLHPDRDKVSPIAGAFRVEPVFFGDEDLEGTAALEVPEAVNKWCAETNIRMNSIFPENDDCLASSAETLRIVARATHDFTRIHPFPDGNGRMSRLISSFMCEMFGCHFVPAPRDKSKYYAALKSADRGKIEEFTGLLASDLVKQYVEFDHELEALTGVPLLDSSGNDGRSLFRQRFCAS